MTSKEALEIIKKYDDFVMVRDFTKGLLSPKTMGSPIKIEFDEAVKTIKRDLEILEIMKNHIYSSDESISIILDDLRCCEDFEKVKEWLNDDKRRSIRENNF